MSIRTLIPVSVALLAVVAATVPALAANSETVANVRDATAAYQDPAAALAAGHSLRFGSPKRFGSEKSVVLGHGMIEITSD